MEANGNSDLEEERREEELREDRPLGPFPLKRHLKLIRIPGDDQ